MYQSVWVFFLWTDVWACLPLVTIMSRKGSFLSSSSSLYTGCWAWLSSNAQRSPAACPFLHYRRQRCHRHIRARWLAWTLLFPELVLVTPQSENSPKLRTLEARYSLHNKCIHSRSTCRGNVCTSQWYRIVVKDMHGLGLYYFRS